MPSITQPDRVGYWGKTSSTIDWCEENYVVTHYIAEFWNTVSNIMMIIPPLLGACYSIHKKMETRMLMCHLGLLAVGIGSWCFHMTLQYSMQLLDELPMIWGSFFLLYSVIELDKPLKTHNRPLQVLLLSYCFFVTVVYLFKSEPIIFQVAYGFMVCAMVGFVCKFIFKYGWRLRIHLQVLAVGSYALGFLLWLMENSYCSNIRGLRNQAVSPIAPVTQLHAWWHVLAGFGTYTGILFVFHSRYTIHSQQPQIKFLFGIFPYLDILKPLKEQ